MKFSKFFSGKKSTGKRKKGPGPRSPKTVDLKNQNQLIKYFRESFELQSSLTNRLKAEADDGMAFFEDYNESRVKLALGAFDNSMKQALYEIIYLLHINHGKLKEINYKPVHENTKAKNDEEKTADLFVEGAPAGVKGIDNISKIFHDDFNHYCLKTFGEIPISSRDPNPPIEGIYSIGSIGTIGHKTIASDLDLEVQYNLSPFLFDVVRWNDEVLVDALISERDYLIKRYLGKKGGAKLEDIKPEQKKRIVQYFSGRIAKNYPFLHHQLLSKKKDLIKEAKNDASGKLRNKMVMEVINLMKKNVTLKEGEESRKSEVLLKQRIIKIQAYIQDKFPEAEIYLFPFSTKDFRRGNFGSTLDSKESSGGAYELIMNYETLMPGIFFTPIVPTHFILPKEINNSQEYSEKIIDYLRFGLLDFYEPIADKLTHQGNTPNLDTIYVAKHYPAVYWEAFKATSGNLAKATLNLLRIEMLLENRVGFTIIQLIKEPSLLDDYVTNGVRSSRSAKTEKRAFAPKVLLDLEKEYPNLQKDPWWLRFKALKIAYADPQLIGNLSEMDSINISEILDFAFALHIRLSDVFKKPGDHRKFDSHREKVLMDFLERAFPEFSDRRNRLNAIFFGDVKAVNDFEKKLRDIFQKSIERIHQKIAALQVQGDEKSTDEFEIWFHYYLKNFKPMPNVVQKSILNHLQEPKGRVQTGFKPTEGWFFKSLQKESSAGKRFQSDFKNLLPDEIMLIENTTFLRGLVYCVINGYYGIQFTGTLNESKTIIEFDRRFSRLEDEVDNNFAFIRPDQIERIMKKIIQTLKPVEISYLDCIQKERKITEVLIFFNLIKFGHFQVLYRDSLNTIFVDLLEIPEFNLDVKDYVNSEEKMFRSKLVHQVLNLFFSEKEIDPFKVDLQIWVNTNSLKTSQSLIKNKEREEVLSDKFKKIILKKFEPLQEEMSQ
ncbi:MAG: hypothetical protein GY786_04855 [Proteobacteria bacterium]|nr:hypothetical protein [Pseudomonadota bacterium]